MEYTPLGIQQEIGEITCMVSVVYWAYAPEQEAMLVELDLDGIRSEVTFSAVDKARDPIPVISIHTFLAEGDCKNIYN